MVSKKGDLSASWIITIVGAILALIVLLIFFYNLYANTIIDQEICHDSVIYRASAGFLDVDKFVPLKCKTEKICITSGLFNKANCSDFAGETGITTIKIGSGSSGQTQIEKIYADEIYQCWNTLGQGKLSLFSLTKAQEFGVGKNIYPTCVICSRIAFDSIALEKNNIDLAKIDVNEYMITHKVPNKEISYYDAMAGENAGKIAEVKPLSEEEQNDFFGNDTPYRNLKELANFTTGNIPTEDYSLESVFPNFKYKSDAILFMQITSPEQGGSLLKIGKLVATTAAGTFMIAPVATGKAVANVGKLCVNPYGALVCAAVALIAVGSQQANVAYNRGLSAGYCGDVSTGTEARNGCSVVRTIAYDAGNISSYCSVIESIA